MRLKTQYVTLENTAIQVSKIGIGAMSFSELGTVLIDRSKGVF